MRIAEEYDSFEDALPKAALALENLGDVPTYHDRHSARHPLASYNVSLSTVGNRLSTVTERLPAAKRSTLSQGHINPTATAALVDATDSLLDALMEHIDDCSLIVKSFFPSSKDARFKDVYRKYGKSIELYRDHIGAVDNQLKHKQGRLRLVAFSWPGGSTLGYFVEGYVGGRGLGPAPAIHPTGNTAFSYNRNLPFHVCGVFFVGACLAEALCSIDSRIGAVPLQPTVPRPESPWSGALRSVSALQRVYFPDEVQQGIPFVRLAGSRLRVEFPASDATIYGPPMESQITSSMAGDGVTKTFKLPYWHWQG